MKPTDSFGGANQLSRQPRHILVVENDNWEYFEMLLAEAEPTLTLTHTPDGYEALRLLQEHQFDLVWTDLMHPGPSGFELLRWLRANQPNLPVIVVTGYPSDSSECQQAFSLGAIDWVSKGRPDFKEHLLAVLSRTAGAAQRPTAPDAHLASCLRSPDNKVRAAAVQEVATARLHAYRKWLPTSCSQISRGRSGLWRPMRSIDLRTRLRSQR